MRDAFARPAGCLLVGVVLALGVAACGDSDDDGGSATGAEQQAESSAASQASSLKATRTGNDKDQIAATLRYIRTVFNAGQSEAFCAKLTSAGRKQLEKFKAPIKDERTCANIALWISKTSKRDGHQQLPVKIYSTKVTGDKAVVKMRGGIAGSRIYSVVLTKDQGEWKVPDTAFTGGKKRS